MLIKSLIYKLLERRHFWRYASFSEIAELYISRTIRFIAMNIISGFTSVYLYQTGYSLQFIMIMWACFYLIKIPFTIFSGHFVARFGPKHGTLISNLFYVLSMISLGLLLDIGMTSIVLWGVFMAMSSALYHVSYMVDFSKVKNSEHAGKEIAFMNILEKTAIGLSPIIGGFIALYFGLQLVIWIAALLFAISVLPLLSSIEPTKTRQNIKFAGFPWKETIRGLVAQVGVGFDYVTTGTVWSLFIVIVIFPKSGLDIYVKLGILSSVTLLVDIAASYAYGKLIDRRRGGNLLIISVIANAIVHASRPFVINPAMIVGINVSNEIATTGYNMAFMRGVFDESDLSGHRILYLCISDMIANFGAAIACVALLVCITIFNSAIGLNMFFFIAAAFVLLIGTANFRLYRK